MVVTTKKFNIGIAGAGISGLMAALELIRAGHSVAIFESRPRTGGRIQTMMVEGIVVDSGPEFIHGNLKETIGLLEKYHITYNPIDGKMYQALGGRLEETFEIIEGWDQLLVKMQALDGDIPFKEFLEKSFPEKRFNELKFAAIRFAEGFDLADVQTASTRALIEEWEKEESTQYRIASGYGTLIETMEKEFIKEGGKIFLNHPVERVDWQSEKILLKVRGDQIFNLDKLIICLPLAVLNEPAPLESIVFIPSLVEKQEAFSQIGFGTVIKIVMIWDSAFWKRLIPDAQFIFSDQFIPVWWTQYPLDRPILTGWLGGPRAALLAGKPDEYFLDKAIESLSGIFSIPPEEIKKGLKFSRIFNWKNEPWSRGAYSYSMMGTLHAKAVCRKPILNRIYFAGEAYYEGPWIGTVEAAVVSGKETASLLLEGIKKK
jgi:monoamine oxidase